MSKYEGKLGLNKLMRYAMSEMTNETAQAATQPATTVATGSSAPTPVSQREAHTARLMEFNKDDGDALGDATTSTENKHAGNAAVKTEPKPKKDEKPRVDPKDRQIAHAVAHKKAMEEQHYREMQDLKRELAEIKAAMTPKKAETVKTEKDFSSKAEFDRYQMEQIANKANEDRFATFKKEQEAQLEQQHRVQAFRGDWTKRVQENFSTPEEVAEFDSLVRNTHGDPFTKEIHEYMQNQPIGPRMMKFLLLRPDLARQLATEPANIRNEHLWELRTSLTNEMKQERANAQSSQASTRQPARKMTVAPAPIGPLSTGGQSDGEVDGAAAVAAYKKRRTGR